VNFFKTKPANQARYKSIAEVDGCLERGGVVLTGNARAARALGRAYGERQRAAGRAAWQTPQVHYWEDWLGALWTERLINADESPMLLSPLRERAVWSGIIGAGAGQLGAVAALAPEAWKLLSDFDRHAECRSFWQGGATGDAEAFRNWALSFDRECRKNQWMSRSDLAALLAQSILQGVIESPPEILLVGFDRITPAQKALRNAAVARGCRIGEWQPPSSDTPPRIIEAKDLRDELAACAAWLRNKLEADPDARLAVIVQDIDGARGEIDRTFRHVLMPASAGIESREPMPYEFSLGQPLATVPVIKAALLLLRWLVEPLAQPEIAWLMLSGFLAAAVDAGPQMAAFDAEVRKHAELPPEAPLDAVASYRPRTSSAAAGSFFRALRGMQELAIAENVGQRARRFSDWIDFADRLLRKARWPGARSLESLEFQALRRWEALCGELAALGFDGSRVSYSEFVTTTERYAREAIFAPESRDAPIQIMGAFESAGQPFDAVWFLGADDRQWPPGGQPHPLLPLWLQQKAGMPHASLEAGWQLANEVTRRLAAVAPDCVFSYAGRDETGELRLSPLLREAFPPPLPAEAFRETMHLPVAPLRPPRTVAFEDSPPVPWPRDLEAGGAAILKSQSACPFQAFANMRLGAEELRVAKRGLSPLDRGNILHDVLESLWSADAGAERCLHSRGDLLNAKANGSLQEIVEHHVDKVFAERRKPFEESEWTRQYLRLERKRLHNVLLQWLDYEAGRVDFTVAEREKQRKTEINGLKLTLRVDRVDLVEGGKLILDYKSGSVSPAMWEGERPDEPQLPLYGLHGGVEDLRGLLFAQIRAGKMGFAGRVENATATVINELDRKHALVRNPLDEETLGAWSDALSNLADQFLAGEASVAPKSYPATCKYCALPSLCRVAETVVVLDAEDEADETDAASETSADD
jgi:probable DNA repair protein